MDPATYMAVFGALTAIGGLLWLIMRIAQSFKKSIKDELDLDSKIEALEEKIDNNKEYTNMRYSEAMVEVSHIKELQESKLVEMSKKIDELRDAVAAGQKATMELLTQILTKENKQ